MLDYLTRFVYRVSINKYNHIPLEMQIGGIMSPHFMWIVIAGGAVIGKNCTIYHQVTIGVDKTKNSEVSIIGNNVFVGARANIIGNLTIGNDCIIGANVIVTKDIPDGSVAVGCNRIIS